MMAGVDAAAAAAAVAGAAEARGGAAAAVARAVVVVAQVGLRVALVDHQIDGHLALQTADVTLAKVIA